MNLIVVEVLVKVASQSTTVTDWRHRISCISMQLILVEVSVKVACRSTTATDWRNRAISMLLIQVAVSVNVACRPWQPQSDGTELTSCNLLWWKCLWKWLVSPRQSQTEGTELSPCYLFWWKYLWKWLVCPQTAAQSYLFWWLCLQSVTVINRQATFTDTSIRISSYVGSSVSLLLPCYLFWCKYLCLQSLYYYTIHNFYIVFAHSHCIIQWTYCCMMWDQLMSPPTLKIMDEKLTVSYSELTGWYLYGHIICACSLATFTSTSSTRSCMVEPSPC